MGYSCSIFDYFTNIPMNWWCGVVLAGIILGLIARKLYLAEKMNVLQACLLVILCEYLFIVLISTVLARNSGSEYLYKLELFWSYRDFAKIGIIGVLFENVYNIFLLFPYGFLYGLIVNRRNGIYIWFSGTVISLIIEFLQLILRRGYFELDDIFHNSVGVMFGYCLCLILKKLLEKGRIVQ